MVSNNKIKLQQTMYNDKRVSVQARVGSWEPLGGCECQLEERTAEAEEVM